MRAPIYLQTVVMHFLLLVLAAAAIWKPETAMARTSSNLRPDQIQVSYVAPKKAAHETVYHLAKGWHVLEGLKELLSALRLPRTLRLKIEGCDGDPNAWYQDDAITVCYEYLDDILRSAPQETTSTGGTRVDAVVGPTLETFLHEVGHAVFDYDDIPILGREEDAADQFAAYILLQFEDGEAQRLLKGAAYEYAREAASPPSKEKNQFADAHGLPAQRLYNLLCMAYGKDPKLFAELVANGRLPKERAEDCAEEYAQVSKAFDRLISPYIDQSLVKRVKAKRWLNFTDGM